MRLRTSWYRRHVLQERIIPYSCTHHQIPDYVDHMKVHKQASVGNANSHQIATSLPLASRSFIQQAMKAGQTRVYRTKIDCYYATCLKLLLPTRYLQVYTAKHVLVPTSLVFIQGSVMVNMSCINEPQK